MTHPTIHIISDANAQGKDTSVSHPEFRLADSYLVANLARRWAAWGHPITYGRTETLDADLGIVHLDQTYVDARSLPETPRRQSLLNRGVRDISKRSFSTLLVRQGDDWKGPVIIKSNLNYFGQPEWESHRSGYFARKRRKLARRHWRLARRLPPREYPVVADSSHVPGWVWRRRDLIVERFVPERDGDLYCIRGWLFFGNRGYTYRLFSTAPTVKTATMVGYEFLDSVPPELEAFRSAHGFDFGKFDYVEVDGKPILFDINKTPTFNGDPESPRLIDLAKGLYDLDLDRSGDTP